MNKKGTDLVFSNKMDGVIQVFRTNQGQTLFFKGQTLFITNQKVFAELINVIYICINEKTR